MTSKNDSILGVSAPRATENTSIPTEVLKNLTPAAARRLQRLVDSSKNLQRLAYGEEAINNRR